MQNVALTNRRSFESEPEAIRTLATSILALVMRHRRVSPGEHCKNERCETCSDIHLEQIMKAIRRNEPVVFILPAFPGKSPNPAKVLGNRPDMAERRSLQFLNRVCEKIQKLYVPGAKIVVCSDGRVFSDVVGITENDISAYHDDLVKMIDELEGDNLSTFNLDDVYPNHSFDEMRSRLMADCSRPIEDLKAEVKEGGDTLQLYCGITRFLFEDALRPDMGISKTALQKESKRKAYSVIQRSKAWDVLLAKYFPDTVRLSIHPQVCGSRKIGIHLMDTEDAWLTPWHSVAVEVKGSDGEESQFRLMKRYHVESLDAQVVMNEGRPSHFMIDSLPEGVTWQ